MAMMCWVYEEGNRHDALSLSNVDGRWMVAFTCAVVEVADGTIATTIGYHMLSQQQR